tara:strand:- start:6040 stop:6267 length:228 start_codon:yes stop_codon:yes gene_type:complete
MKSIPYTTSTGVKIGSRYNESPKPMPIDDEDMIYIQSLFIHPPEWHRQRNMERMTLIVCTGFVIFVGVVLLMTGK